MDDQKKSTLIQFVYFILIGGMNTLLTLAVYFILVYLGLHYSLALIADYIFGISFSFFMNKHFTFHVQERATAKMFSRMLLTYGFLFLGNIILLAACVEFFEFDEYLAQILSFGVLLVIAFLAQKLFVFHVEKM